MAAILGRLGGGTAVTASSFTLAGSFDSRWLGASGAAPGSRKESSRQSKTGEDPCNRPVNCSGTPAPWSSLGWELSGESENRRQSERRQGESGGEGKKERE